MGLNHAADAENPTPRIPWPVLAALAAVAAVVAAAMWWLWPSGMPEQDDPPGARTAYGTVTAIESEPCPDLSEGVEIPAGSKPGPSGCGSAVIEITEGPGAGGQASSRLPAGLNAPAIGVGDDLTLMYLDDDGQGVYQIMDHQRGMQLWILGAAFALAVVAFGRWRGLTALAGLAVTFAVLLWFVVPAILEGEQPLLVAIAGSAAIMLVVLYLTHGFKPPVTIAVIGTLLSLTLTGVLAALATAMTHLTGVSDESSNYLSLVFGVNTQGLLLASILIGSLGVLDDVTVTQSVTVAELARANPDYGFRRLYAAATRVGRAHIASVVNTIILAYAGASLPVLLLIAAADRPIGQVLTQQVIAQELVRSAVGTIGLIAAVPITTAMAALAARGWKGSATEPDEPPSTPRPRNQRGQWLEMYEPAETSQRPDAAPPADRDGGHRSVADA